MGLQVWLPLNGNIQNQGLINGTTEKGTYISFTNGKIGQCATSSSSNNTIRLTSTEFPSMFANGNAYTLTCWVKVTGNADNGWIVKIGSNICGLWWAKSVARLVWNENDKGKRIASSPIADDYTNWHHIASVIDKTISGNITARHYIDGVLSTENGTTTWDCSSHSQPAGNYIDIYPYNALINDVRIYDHALSPLEVKEISKALVLHLPLDREGLGQVNFVKDSGPQNTSSPIKEGDNNTYSKVYYLDEAGTAAIAEGATLTISFNYEIVGATKGYIYAQLNGTQILPASGANIVSVADQPSGRYAKKVVVSADQAAYTSAFRVRARLSGSSAYGYPEVGAYFRIWNVKLEVGDKATAWCPNEADDLYTAYHCDDVIHDTSGYQYNGIRYGTLSYDSDSPRYNTSTYFNGSSDIRTEKGSFGWFDFKEGTVAAWFKPANTTQKYASVGVQNDGDVGSRSFSICNYSGKAATVVGYDSSWGSSSSGYSMAANTWYHLCATITNGDTVKLYVNGELVQTRTVTNTTGTIASTTQFAVGVDLPGGDEHFTGKISDVRFYTTCLNESDVRDLYAVGASLSDTGVLFSSEVSEV